MARFPVAGAGGELGLEDRVQDAGVLDAQGAEGLASLGVAGPLPELALTIPYESRRSR